MYKIYNQTYMGVTSQCIIRTDGPDSYTSFLFDPANTDYANFKKQVLDGAELQDVDGKPMQDAVQFVKELP
jgi:hypothetical protein